MPADTLTAPPPAQTAAPPAKTSAQVAAAAAKTQINVSTPTGDTPPSKPGSAMDRMRQELQKKAITPDPSSPNTRPADPKRPGIAHKKEDDEAAKLTTPPEEGTPEGEEGDPTKTVEGDPEKTPAKTDPKKPDGKPADKTKVNPWKLYDEAKGRAAKAEARIAELEKGGATPEAIKPYEERATKAEARAKELEQEIIFYDYSKSDEFKQQYEVPYEKAWTRAMGDLKELTVEDGKGSSRFFNANDLLELVNLPLQKARELAESLFGDFANDVMGHRKEIRGLLEARSSKLEEAKRDGSKMLRERMETQTRAKGEIQKAIQETWDGEKEAVKQDKEIGHLFTPAEGDDEGNAAIERGYKLVDEAWSANPEDPKLTAEQRKDIVKKHAAIRNRAAAFGRMRIELKRQLAKVAELEKQLAEYADSDPPMKGSEEAPAAIAEGGSAMDRMRAKLRERAR